MDSVHPKEENDIKGVRLQSKKKVEASSRVLRPLENTMTSSSSSSTKFTIYKDPSSSSSKAVKKKLVTVATNTESTRTAVTSVHVQTSISHAEYGAESSPSFLFNRVDFELLAEERQERIQQLEELNASLDMHNAELLLDKSDLEEQLASKEAENGELREAVQSAQRLVDAIKPIMGDDDSNDGEGYDEEDNNKEDILPAV